MTRPRLFTALLALIWLPTILAEGGGAGGQPTFVGPNGGGQLSDARSSRRADPARGQPFPRTMINQFEGAVPDWYARFDLAMTRIGYAGKNGGDPGAKAFIQKVKSINPDIIFIPTEDFNACDVDNGFFGLQVVGKEGCPPEWRLYDAQGNELHNIDYGDYDNNLSKFSELVTAIPAQVAWNVAYYGVDGFGTDGLFARGHYAWYFDGWWADVDMNRNRVKDVGEFGKSGTVANWGDGVDQMLHNIRLKIGPDKFFIVNTGSGDTPGIQDVNGYYDEFHGWPLTGDYWLHGKTDLREKMQQVYQPAIFLQAGKPDPDDPAAPEPVKNDLRFLRWGLTDAMLGGTYFEFGYRSSMDHYWNYYFDEFDLDVGWPTSEMQRVKGDVWVRFFDHGAALAYSPPNPALYPQTSSITVTEQELAALPGYSGPYFRFLGGQDTALNGAEAMNNGEAFTSVTFQAHKYVGYGESEFVSSDGIILVSSPQTVVSDIIVDNVDQGTSSGSDPAALSGGFAQTDPCDRATADPYSLRDCGIYGQPAYAFASAGAGKAVFTPNIGIAGDYEVFEWHGAFRDGSGASNVRHTIAHAGGETVRTVNQRLDPGGWNSLGVFRFEQGRAGHVTVSAEGADGVVMADAVMFVYGGEGAPGGTATPTRSPTRTPTPTPGAGTTFADVPLSHWAHGSIEKLFQGGLIVGCQATPVRKYCPEEVLTRAQAAVFVERGVHGGGFLPPQPSSMPFADVPLGEWYAKWVKALWDDGFTAGCATDPLSFCPGQGHTRGEAAVFFVRLLRGKDYQPTETASLPYVDVPQGAWYRKWVGAAYAAGIVQGCEDDANRGDDRYRPQEGITRAEAACMLAKAKDLPPGPTPTPTITPTPTPRPTQPPGEGHTYPRSAVFTWCCGSAEYYAMFDLVISRKEDAGVIAQAKQLNPNLLWLPTHDLNTFLDHYPELPGEWALVDSQGNTITLGGFYGGDAFSDLSDLGVRVNGQRLIDRIPEVLAQLVAETGADGVASDGLYYRGHISWYMWDDVDLDRNGVNDLTEHGKDWVVTHWGNGVDLMLNKLRDLLGPDKLIVINTGSADLPTAGAINGLYLEHASSGWDGYTRDLFSSYFARVFQPPVFVLNYYVDPRDPQSPSRTYEHFQYMRFGLARALLEGDYYDFNAFESGEHYFSEYFDEFDLDVGYPRGRAVEIAPEVWARIFDRGAVIGNLNDHPVALSEAQLRAAPGYSGPYWRFQGCQDAAVNNGQPFDSVTLKGHSYIGYGDSGEVVGDGILLVSQPTTACPEIPRPEGGYWRDGR